MKLTLGIRTGAASAGRRSTAQRPRLTQAAGLMRRRSAHHHLGHSGHHTGLFLRPRRTEARLTLSIMPMSSYGPSTRSSLRLVSNVAHDPP